MSEQYFTVNIRAYLDFALETISEMKYSIGGVMEFLECEDNKIQKQRQKRLLSHKNLHAAILTKKSLFLQSVTKTVKLSFYHISISSNNSSKVI